MTTGHNLINSYYIFLGYGQFANYIIKTMNYSEDIDMEKTKEIIDYLKFSTKLRVLRYAKDCGKNKDACEVFGVKKSTFYKWKKEFEQHGEKGLVRKKTVAKNFPNQIKIAHCRFCKRHNRLSL